MSLRVRVCVLTNLNLNRNQCTIVCVYALYIDAFVRRVRMYVWVHVRICWHVRLGGSAVSGSTTTNK